MSYELVFKKTALKEWRKLGATIQFHFKKKLQKILVVPHIASAKLTGANNLYKIKLRQSGYRLVYDVNDRMVTVTVVAIGKRERSAVYKKALERISEEKP